MKNQFNSFIEYLSKVQLPLNVFNQYSHDNHENLLRRKNLFLYLQQMAKLNPHILLVGEAPGYRGCRLTGVPFTSEFILLTGIDEIGLFGKLRGYQKTNEFEKVWKESSATVVWEALAKARPIPLLWNAFPFHPFKEGNELSNRTPIDSELKIGEGFLKELIKLFKIEKFVALGDKSETTLRNMGVICEKVRHPAKGGKNEFVGGINKVINNCAHIT
jgi:uracil-DNA glycosylase